MSILKKIYDYFEEGLCCVMLGTMILCLTAQVVIRMTIGSSIAWTEELSRYTFLWSVYLGAALAAKRGAHVRVTAQFLWMKDNMRMFFRVIADIVWVVMLIVCAFNALPVIQEGFEFLLIFDHQVFKAASCQSSRHRFNGRRGSFDGNFQPIHKLLLRVYI
mgnify:CR=1 FL=1